MSPADFDLSMAGRLLLASFCGGLIGLEREIHGRPAGFRTHLLVSLGSALFVIVSISFYRLYGNFSGSGVVGVDPGRVAAQVVTGIGFLGAGAIMRERGSIRGLTTAACLWVAAAVGVACGLGLFVLASFVTAISLISLIALKKIEGQLSHDHYAMLLVSSRDVPGQLERVSEIVSSCGMTMAAVGMERRPVSGELLYELQVKMRGKELGCGMLERVAELEGIKEVSLKLSASV